MRTSPTIPAEVVRGFPLPEVDGDGVWARVLWWVARGVDRVLWALGPHGTIWVEEIR